MLKKMLFSYSQINVQYVGNEESSHDVRARVWGLNGNILFWINFMAQIKRERWFCEF